MNKAVIGHDQSCMVSQSRRSGLISGTKALPHGITVGTEELMQGRSILRIAINTKDALTYPDLPRYRSDPIASTTWRSLAVTMKQ